MMAEGEHNVTPTEVGVRTRFESSHRLHEMQSGQR